MSFSLVLSCCIPVYEIYKYISTCLLTMNKQCKFSAGLFLLSSPLTTLSYPFSVSGPDVGTGTMFISGFGWCGLMVSMYHVLYALNPTSGLVPKTYLGFGLAQLVMYTVPNHVLRNSGVLGVLGIPEETFTNTLLPVHHLYSGLALVYCTLLLKKKS